jgi:hypothetical protein
MGIELPGELADVAAKAGVQWPQADEEDMRSSAQAWRQAGTKITALAKDADGTANQALSAVSGTAGTAAQQHWHTFVAPDTGHLTSTAQGCTDAADRLDHAADQVGAAKVKIVQHLVDLAKNTDAATQAAAAGHPTALAGLPTAVQGTASSVAQVNHSLTTSIRLDSTTGAGRHAQPGPVNLLGPAGSPAATGLPALTGANGPLHTVPPVTHDVSQLAAPITHAPGQLAGSLAPITRDPAQMAGSVVPITHGPGQLAGSVAPITHDPGQLAGSLAPIMHDPAQLAGSVAPITHDPGQLAGAVTHDPGQLAGSVAPASHDPGQLAAAVGPVLPVSHDPGQLASPPGPIPVATHGGVPGIDSAHTGPIPVGVASAAHSPLGPTDLHASSAPTPPMGITVAQSAAPALATPPMGFDPAHAGIPAAPPIPQHSEPPPAADFSAPTPPLGIPTQAAPPSAPLPPPAGQPGLVGTVDVPPADQAAAGTRQGPRSAAPTQPPGHDSDSNPVSPVSTAGRSGLAPARRDAVSLFLVYLFPIGQLPKASSRPVRQLPPPPPETDFAAGLRFEPHDHPESAMIDPETALATEPAPGHPGFAAEDPEVIALTDGHDPLGGQHERDWDRRFLVRPPDPDHERAAEYAWPPGELFPEGGRDAGEPVVLAEDTVLDRFGGQEGRVFADDGTPFASRSLPPDQLAAGYHRYQVTRALPMWRTVSAAWFGQPGGGVRYRAVYPAADLVAMGYLTEITGTDHGH